MRKISVNKVTRLVLTCLFDSGAPSRRTAETGPSPHSDDSDGSTDSEEELDSPRRILPMPSTPENMDIDSSTTTGQPPNNREGQRRLYTRFYAGFSFFN